MSSTKDVRPEGAIVCWRTASGDRDAVREALRTIGCDSLLPDRDTPLASAKRALVEWGKDKGWRGSGSSEVLVRQTTGGAAVVREHKRTSDGRADDAANKYDTLCQVVVGKDGVTHYAEADYVGELGAWREPPAALSALYERERNVVTAHLLGFTVKQVLMRLGCTRVRPEGGVLYVPQDKLSTVEQLRVAVEAAAPGARIYLIRTVIDEAAIRCLGDALAAEVQQAESEIEGYLDENRDPPPRYTKRLEELTKKVGSYRDALGAELAEATALAESTTKRLTEATFLEMVEDLI